MPPTEKQKRFTINTFDEPETNKTKSKAYSEKAAKDCKIRRDIEWHMEQRRLKKELADFGIMDENLSQESTRNR